MLKNYFKITFRSLWKHKAYSIINLLGLSLGLAGGIFILLYVVDEVSYDNFHINSNRVYRVNSGFSNPNTGEKGGTIDTNAWPVGKVLETEYPEVEAVLFTRSASYLLVDFEEKQFRQNMYFASNDFFKIFSFPMVEGNPANALAEPYSVVITESMAKKYFPNTEALGNTLIMMDTLQFEVTGVIEDVPANSHIQFEMLLSFSTYADIDKSFDYSAGWGNFNMRNYILLKEGSDATAFVKKAANIYEEKVSEMLREWGTSAYLDFEKMADIYLKSKAGNGMGPAGDIDRVYLVSGIGIFVIILACINFINLTTARSSYRSREVGLRKVVGSSRMRLIFQFLSEAFLLNLFSFFIALSLAGLALPFFNELLSKSYSLASLMQPKIIFGISILIIAVSFFSGFYPAIVLSGMKPVEILKNKVSLSEKGVTSRRMLVVFQFMISVLLVLATLIVIDQLSFMQKENLGFVKNEIFVINGARNAEDKLANFKNELKTYSGVAQLTFANAVPGRPGWQGQIAYPEGMQGDRSVSLEYMAVDDAYIPALDLEIIAGRNFDSNRPTDLAKSLIINEAAVKILGWDSPEDAIGKKIESPSDYPAGEVIGVIKDYHQSGLQQKISAVAMNYDPQNSYLIAIRFKASNTKSVLAESEKLWKQHFPDKDFNYFFLDEEFARQYANEERLAKLFAFFSTITIVIGVIGLLGLVSFMIAARTKEIGIRKVMGARVITIVRLLSLETLVLVMIACLIAIPLAWYGGNEWLNTFAYRTDVNPKIFLIAFMITLSVSFITISLLTVKAAISNPVKSLRYE